MVYKILIAFYRGRLSRKIKEKDLDYCAEAIAIAIAGDVPLNNSIISIVIIRNDLQLHAHKEIKSKTSQAIDTDYDKAHIEQLYLVK